MSEAKQTIPAPRAPHSDSLKDPAYTILDRSGTRLLHWCPRHLCGAVYAIEANVWNMQSPITFGQFLEALQVRNLAPEADTDDHARWVEACTQPLPRMPTAPGGHC